MSDYLFCRGPLEIKMVVESGGRNAFYVYFDRNPGPAGEKGQRLQPGKAAWKEQILLPDQPEKLYLRFTPGDYSVPTTDVRTLPPMDWENRNYRMSAIHKVIFAHTANPKAVLRFEVDHDDDEAFYFPGLGEDINMRVLFPFDTGGVGGTLGNVTRDTRSRFGRTIDGVRRFLGSSDSED